VAAIDVGNAAENRPFTLAAFNTVVDLANPAELNGSLNSIEIYAQTALTGMIVGTFYLVSGTTYKCRDSAILGNVAAGSKQTITLDSIGNPLAISIEIGDFIGCYFESGLLDTTTIGGTGIMWILAESIDPGDQAVFGFLSGYMISLYATGVSSVYAGSGGHFNLPGFRFE
jgi:hypothetical protein